MNRGWLRRLLLAGTFASALVPPIELPIGQIVDVAPPLGWLATADSNGVPPVDPARETAKPIVLPLSEEALGGFNVTEDMVISWQAYAKGGIASFLVHIEGGTFPVQLSRRVQIKHGKLKYLPGYHFRLKKGLFPSDGSFNIRVEVIPNDPTMQRRMMGPYRYSVRTGPTHDIMIEVRPSQPPSGLQVQTIGAAKVLARTLGAKAPLATLMEDGDYDVATGFSGAVFNLANAHDVGHFKVTTAPGVKARIKTLAAAGAMTTHLQPQANGVWWYGPGIEIDFNYIFYYRGADGHNGQCKGHLFDGVRVYDSSGYNSRTCIRHAISCWEARSSGDTFSFVDVAFDNMWDAINSPSAATKFPLVQGCTFEDIAQDVAKGPTNIFGCTDIGPHGHDMLEVGFPAFRIAYDGAQAGHLATIRVSANVLYLDLKAGASAGTAAVVNTVTLGRNNPGGYKSQTQIVAELNALPDWSGTLDADIWDAFTCFPRQHGTPEVNSGPISSDFVLKGVEIQIWQRIDIHADWSQPTSFAALENAAFVNNKGYKCEQVQLIYITAAPHSIRDVVYGNYAAHHANATSGETDVNATSGISGHASHLLLWGIVMTQMLYFAAVNTSTDAYCEIAGCIFGNSQSSLELRSATHAMTIRDSIFCDGVIPPGAINCSTREVPLSGLLVSPSTGNFAPKPGANLPAWTNPLGFDLSGNLVANGALGALAA